MPSGASASSIALWIAAGAPMVPDSPQPFTPSGLVVHGCVSSVSETNSGTDMARGMG